MKHTQPKLDLEHELNAGHPNQLQLALPDEHEELPPAESDKLLEETHEKVKSTLEYEGEGHA